MTDEQPIRDILDELGRCGDLLPLIPTVPSADSLASVGLATKGLEEFEAGLLRWGPARARQALSIAADSLTALARVMALPPHRFASAALSRTVIECSAIAFWLADRDLAPATRIDRLLRVKRDDLEQERRISEAGLEAEPKPALEEAVAFANKQAEAFDKATQAAGLTAKKMPPSTDLVESVFGAGYTYRLDSALGHGTPFAAFAINQMYASKEGAGAAYLFTTHEAFDAYLRTVWECAHYLDSGENEALRGAIAQTCARLGFRDEICKHILRG